MLDINKIRKEFSFFNKNKELHYLDSAASSLKVDRAVDAMSNYLKYNGTNVHRGAYKLSYDATVLYEKSREIVADFINANINEVIFTKGTTNSLNMLAVSLFDYINEGDEIIISELEHHSNFLPWHNLAKRKNAILKFIPIEDGMITVNNFKKVISNKTKLVVTHHVSNVLGNVVPLKEIINEAHKYNALVIVDAAQSVSHIKIDVKDLDADFLAFSSHKMYGPNGVGVLYGKHQLLEMMSPAEYGGEMIDEVNLEKPTFKSPPYKFEAGTPPIAEAIGLGEAIKFLNSFDFNLIKKEEMKIREYIINELSNLNDVTIYNKNALTGIITFNLKDIHPHDAASIYDYNNVLVRAGEHCNQLTMKYLGVNSTIRLSLGIYNTIDDGYKFIEATKKTIEFFKRD